MIFGDFGAETTNLDPKLPITVQLSDTMLYGETVDSWTPGHYTFPPSTLCLASISSSSSSSSSFISYTFFQISRPVSSVLTTIVTPSTKSPVGIQSRSSAGMSKSQPSTMICRTSSEV